MGRKVALYALFISAVAGAVWWKEGAKVPESGNLVAALLLLPLFAWVIWLRRDWAPEEARRREIEKKKRQGGAAAERGASQPLTDAAERP